MKYERYFEVQCEFSWRQSVRQSGNQSVNQSVIIQVEGLIRNQRECGDF